MFTDEFKRKYSNICGINENERSWLQLLIDIWINQLNLQHIYIVFLT